MKRPELLIPLGQRSSPGRLVPGDDRVQIILGEPVHARKPIGLGQARLTSGVNRCTHR